MLRKKAKISSIMFCIGLLIINSPIIAKKQDPKRTQQTLKDLEYKIAKLQEDLKKSNNKNELIMLELAKTEKNINEALKNKKNLTQRCKQIKTTLSTIQKDIQNLTDTMDAQKKQLKRYIVLQYKITSSIQKKTKNKETIQHWHTQQVYLQSIIEAQKKLMQSIKEQSVLLEQKKKQQALQLRTYQDNQYALECRENQLMQDKKYQNTLLMKLSNEIQSKKTSLKQYQINKNNLLQLVKRVETRTPTWHTNFAQKHKKLPSPLHEKDIKPVPIRQGIFFNTAEGTNIYAISDGKIVFSDWLNGYGLLLIIDHGHGFMSLYAHNQSLDKSRGTRVKQGELIANAGHSGGMKKNGLYFEIRHHGKTVSPLEWLLPT